MRFYREKECFCQFSGDVILRPLGLIIFLLFLSSIQIDVGPLLVGWETDKRSQLASLQGEGTNYYLLKFTCELPLVPKGIVAVDFNDE